MFAVDIKLVTKSVDAWLKKISDRKDAFEKRDRAYVGAISIFVYQDVINHFERQQGPEGGWKSWSDSYRNAMEKKGKGGNQILQDSGRLRNAFTPGKWRNKGKDIEWFNPAVTKGGFPYAYAHDTGGPQLPKRQFMWLSNAALDKISEATAKFLIGD